MNIVVNKKIDSHKKKSKYSTPKKGTKRRLLLNLLLNKDGASFQKLREHGLDPTRLNKDMEWILDDCGFDLRKIGVIPEKDRKPNSVKTSPVYRIVGRYYWDGRYRSFMKDCHDKRTTLSFDSKSRQPLGIQRRCL